MKFIDQAALILVQNLQYQIVPVSRSGGGRVVIYLYLGRSLSRSHIIGCHRFVKTGGKADVQVQLLVADQLHRLRLLLNLQSLAQGGGQAVR